VYVNWRKFRVHKNVMASRSMYFESALAHLSTLKKSKRDKIYVDRVVTDRAFSVFLHFLYTGNVPVSAKETLELANYNGAFQDLEREVLVAADFFCDASMLQCCTHLFGERLTVQTAIEQLVWASSMSSNLVEHLVPLAMKYVVKNAVAIMVSRENGQVACL
jgi:hypothetical protein